jgi:hypothetical protein
MLPAPTAVLSFAMLNAFFITHKAARKVMLKLIARMMVWTLQ